MRIRYEVLIEVDTGDNEIDASALMHEERLQEVVEHGYPFVPLGTVRIISSRKYEERDDGN